MKNIFWFLKKKEKKEKIRQYRIIIYYLETVVNDFGLTLKEEEHEITFVFYDILKNARNKRDLLWPLIKNNRCCSMSFYELRVGGLEKISQFYSKDMEIEDENP